MLNRKYNLSTLADALMFLYMSDQEYRGTEFQSNKTVMYIYVVLLFTIGDTMSDRR